MRHPVWIDTLGALALALGVDPFLLVTRTPRVRAIKRQGVRCSRADPFR